MHTIASLIMSVVFGLVSAIAAMALSFLLIYTLFFCLSAMKALPPENYSSMGVFMCVVPTVGLGGFFTGMVFALKKLGRRESARQSKRGFTIDPAPKN